MFEGDLEEGELEIGQSSALIDSILSVEEVFEKLLKEFRESSCPEL
jgi:enoyl-[acyl-carrier protein] reductase II